MRMAAADIKIQQRVIVQLVKYVKTQSCIFVVRPHPHTHTHTLYSLHHYSIMHTFGLPVIGIDPPVEHVHDEHSVVIEKIPLMTITLHVHVCGVGSGRCTV